MDFRGGKGGSLGRSTRWVLAASAAALLGGWCLAGWLVPDARGYGTHQQLGLAPCAYRAATGRPCPSCGMTTAFAWYARGRFGRSWSANPAVAGLAPASLGAIGWMIVAAARGRPGPFRSIETPLVATAVFAVALTLLSWTVRMTLGGR